MKKIQKSRLIIVAGPNGSGKTTITEKLLRHEWMKDCVYINPDFIAKQKFGDWNSPKSVLKAANYAQEMRENCLADMSSMALETPMFRVNDGKIAKIYKDLAPWAKDIADSLLRE